jgi:hypothetical protein
VYEDENSIEQEDFMAIDIHNDIETKLEFGNANEDYNAHVEHDPQIASNTAKEVKNEVNKDEEPPLIEDVDDEFGRR